MEFKTINQWDEQLWNDQVSRIYHQAFDGKGAKPDKIIRNMFRKRICNLHVGIVESQVAAMSLTGNLEGSDALIIDYLAVDKEWQHRGIGMKLMNYIHEWAITEAHLKSMVIEVESEETPETVARNHFWEKCGFTLTKYVHEYIWVPESYRAMYLKLVPDTNISEDGKELFKYIERFHKASYQGS
ncbi:GNAT family N-acetyltransferase [Neobacillus drentensis]|uniref:GNAT family N-acetyltransferase n=1 Tax=Neobacillus drentensis TaxID=220684 RepID=UPI002FFE828C